MLKKLFLASLVLCMALLGTTSPSLAQTRQRTPEDLITKLEREGWKIINEGVLRRELRNNEVETFVFGVEGFTWKLQDLRAQHQALVAAFEVDPTPELKKAIANHRKEIASTLRMIERARVAEANGVTEFFKVDCTINFGYDAAASYKTNTQGVWAEARANFSVSGTACSGFSGEVYAYAYAQATVNGGPVTQTFTDGPRSGANVSAYAYASVNGGPSCQSYAYASVTSNNLNPSSYSKSANNYDCPAPPPDIVISSGPSIIDLRSVFCKTVTWGSTVTGGVAPYSYSWTVDGGQVGTGSSLTLTVCRGDYYYNGGFTLAASVTDGLGRSDTDSRWVSVWEPDPCTDPCFCSAPSEAAPIYCY